MGDGGGALYFEEEGGVGVIFGGFYSLADDFPRYPTFPPSREVGHLSPFYGPNMPTCSGQLLFTRENTKGVRLLIAQQASLPPRRWPIARINHLGPGQLPLWGVYKPGDLWGFGTRGTVRKSAPRQFVWGYTPCHK